MSFPPNSTKIDEEKAARVRKSVLARLGDTPAGRRDLRWLAGLTGIPYATLWRKIKAANRPITEDDERALEKAFDVSAGGLRRPAPQGPKK